MKKPRTVSTSDSTTMRWAVCAALSVFILLCTACHRGAVPTQSARIVADFSQGQVTLMGSLPNKSLHARLLDEAHRRYGPAQVRDQVSVDERVIPAPWLESDALFFPLIDNILSDGQASFDGAHLVVTGEVPTQVMRNQLQTRIDARVGSPVRVENHVQVSP